MLDKNHVKAFGIYLANRQYSSLAITNYKVTVSKFYEIIDNNPKDITIEDIERYIHAMNTDINNGKPFSNNTKVSKYCGLKAYIEYLNNKVLKDRKIVYDKALLHPPSAIIPDKQVLTKDEVLRIFKEAESSLRDLALLKVLYYSTQRKVSVQSLNLSDINWQTGQVHIKHGTKMKKGVYEYWVSIKEALPTLKDYIDNYREIPKQGYQDALFLNGSGKRICKESINVILKRYVVKAKISKRVYPHLFRATACSIMNDAGMTRDQIRMRTGHRNIKSLDTYIRPDPTKSNKLADDCLSLEKPTPSSKPIPKKPEPETDNRPDSYIAKTEIKPLTATENIRLKEMELQLALKQADIELERLKLQNLSHNQSQTQDNNIYG